MITKEELYQIEERGKKEFISTSKNVIEYAMKQAAMAQKRNVRVEYNPLLDSYFQELMSAGIQFERDGLTNAILIW